VFTSFLQEIIACPVCKKPLDIVEASKTINCTNCCNTFQKGRYTWNFIPPNIFASSLLWQAWEQLQSNSVAGYEASPEQNLSVGNRKDCQAFAQFCEFNGLVLDVGCGPQPWPAYFDDSHDATYIGIDPLADTGPSDFLKITALAEYLPFRADIFNHVLFSTTLDHFVDPQAALEEAKRVCSIDGEIDVWLGEKHPDAPKPAHSPDWYLKLKKPKLADDLFHIKRLNADAFIEIVEDTALTLLNHKVYQVDAYRANHFFRLKRRL